MTERTIYQPRPKPGRPGDVYFIACDNRFVKVGFTYDIDVRLADLQTACPFELKVIGMLRNTTMVMIHEVNRGFYPLTELEVVTFFRVVHRAEVAELVAQEYISSAPDSDPESCSTPT